MPSILPSIKLSVAARSSLLSRAQVKELQGFLGLFVELYPTFLETYGDLDRKTSLQTLGKTDFFTREVDEEVLSGRCDLAIHSAKDLPEKLPVGLSLIAMTKGIDPRDALILRFQETIESLPASAVIATSSERRAQAVRALRDDLTFIDLRGTIQERLELLDKGQADGVVVAEAAIIRLKLTHLTRIYLPGQTTAGQGQLAIVGKTNQKKILETQLSCHDHKNELVFFT